MTAFEIEGIYLQCDHCRAPLMLQPGGALFPGWTMTFTRTGNTTYATPHRTDCPRSQPATPRCDTCSGTGWVKQEGQIGVPGSGVTHGCPDCEKGRAWLEAGELRDDDRPFPDIAAAATETAPPTGRDPMDDNNPTPTEQPNQLSHAQQRRVAALHEARAVLTTQHPFGQGAAKPGGLIQVAEWILDSDEPTHTPVDIADRFGGV